MYGTRDITKNWGTSSVDVHFIQSNYPGKYDDNNTYHYDNRYVFHAIGDVETISGSYKKNSSGSFSTDYRGSVTNGVYTASVDFSNETFLDSDIGLGKRALGTTIKFVPSSSVSFGGGKFIDETYIYPANHIYITGTSKDDISDVMYGGTQNAGGGLLESTVMTDLSSDAFYWNEVEGAEGVIVGSG